MNLFFSNNIKKAVTSTLLLVGALVSAQMVNSGEFTVLPGTEVGLVSNFENTNTGIFLNDGDVYVYGNFQNNGLVNYLNTGLTRFAGNNLQVLSGTQEMFFYNTLFSNTLNTSYAIELSGRLTVDNNSDFTSGIVNNRDFGGVFTFSNLSTQVNTNDSSHVDGEVIKLGDSAFEFPIGQGGFFRPSAMSAPITGSDDFRSTYFFQSSNIAATPHEKAVGSVEQIDNTE